MVTLPAALLAVLLLAATIDPRLAEPLRLLAEVRDRDTADGHAGQFYADLPESLGLTLAVGMLPHGAAGRYDAGAQTVTIAESVLGEDPRVVAVVLAHELTHARQVRAGGSADCVRMEVEAYVAEALVWASFWMEQVPWKRRALERHLTNLTDIAVNEGAPGFYKMVVDAPGYQDQCRLWVPDGAGQSTPPQPVPSGPDPALMSRCVPLARDLAEGINRDLRPGSDRGGQVFTAFANLCQIAVQEHGARGFACFETAWRRAIRLNRVVEPGSRAAVRAAEAEYNLCVSQR